MSSFHLNYKALATYYFPDELNCLSLEAGKDDSILNSHISGQIGKLRTYKSGKRDIIIGNSVYDYQEVQNLCIEVIFEQFFKYVWSNQKNYKI